MSSKEVRLRGHLSRKIIRAFHENTAYRTHAGGPLINQLGRDEGVYFFTDVSVLKMRLVSCHTVQF